MLRSMSWLLPAVAAFGLMLTVSAAKAADAVAGVITGTVVDKDGKAVADVKVNLAKPREQGATGQPEALATATTDKDGKFELKFDTTKVADGEYTIGCRVQAQGNARAKVTIKDGKADPASVDLKLKPRQAGGNGGGNRGAAN